MFHMFKFCFCARLALLFLLQFGVRNISANFLEFLMKAVIILKEQTDLIVFQIFFQMQILPRLFRLLLQRADLLFQFC